MFTKEALKGMTNAALVVEHNKFSPETVLKGWKGKKEDLIKKVMDAEKKARPQPVNRPTRTIREAAEDLLLKVLAEKDGRKIGYTYEEILDLIMKEFGSSTTVACLRWYAVHLNKDPKVRMPLRPRKRVER